MSAPLSSLQYGSHWAMHISWGLKQDAHPACIISILIPLLILRLYLGPGRERGFRHGTALLNDASLLVAPARGQEEKKIKKINRRKTKNTSVTLKCKCDLRRMCHPRLCFIYFCIPSFIYLLLLTAPSNALLYREEDFFREANTEPCRYPLALAPSSHPPGLV